MIKDLILKEKLRKILVFLFMCAAFSIPFGEQYTKKILALSFLFWISIVKIEDIKKVLKNKVIIIFIFLVLMYLISLFWSSNVSLGLHYISQMIRYILFPILMYVTTIKKEELKYIINSFIFSMFINEIISYLIYFDLYQTEFSKTRGYPVGFINHAQYSVLVAFTSILLLNQLLKLKTTIMKIVYSVFFITMTINLVISGGRTGYVTYFGSLIVLFFIYFKPSIKNFILVLAFPTLVFTIGYKYNSVVEQRMLATLNAIEGLKHNNYNTSLGMRIAYYFLSYDIVKQPENSFIFGVGIGDLESEMIKAEKRTKLVSCHLPHLHSSYLTAYVRAGVIALILFLLFIYYLWRLDIKDDEFKFIKYLFVLNLFMSNIPDIMFYQKTTMLFFSLYIGILLTQYYYEQEQRKEKSVNFSNNSSI